jgi:hypothetical protein
VTNSSQRGLCHGKKSELESLVEQPIAATDRSQCGLCHGKKSELESLAEQPIAAPNSSQRGLCHDKKSERVLLAARAKCLKPHESSCASKVACAKCFNSHKSSCASKVAHAKCLNSHESSCASLLVARAKCLNSNESSCASLLAVRAKPLKSNKAHTITPSLSLKFIGESILKEAQFAQTTFQAFKFIVASTSIANFQLIVDLFLIPNREGACAVPITHYSASEGDQILSSASDKSILFSLTTIHVEWLIVEFIKTDINVQGSRAPSTTFPTMHNRKSKFIVASHDSKTFLHFSKGIAIFFEGDQENANNRNDTEDDDVVVWQKSNLPSLLLLTSAISTQAAFDTSAPLDTLAATASFGQISLIDLSALSNYWLIGLIGVINLDLICASALASVALLAC